MRDPQEILLDEAFRRIERAIGFLTAMLKYVEEKTPFYQEIQEVIAILDDKNDTTSSPNG